MYILGITPPTATFEQWMSDDVTGNQLSASSMRTSGQNDFTDFYDVVNGRLLSPTTGATAWCAASDDKHPWFQVGLHCLDLIG